MSAEAANLIIVAGVPMTDESTIFAEIEALLAERGRPSLDRLEHGLTSGYAAALALEAERSRLERGITTAAGLLEGRGDGERADEIARLARALSTADADLERLRAMLARLRARTTAARAA